MKSRMFLFTALSPLLGACATILPRATPPAQLPEPLVVSPACMVAPVDPDQIEEPPMPPPIERPAGEPTASTWQTWMAYVDRRRERAELAGLFFQGKSDANQHAYELTAEQMRQCNAWAVSHNGERR